MANASNYRYPIRFDPIFRERIWGGRRLETVLGKRLPPDVLIGESWEISDHGESLSVVAGGPLHGRTLRDLLHSIPEAIVGSEAMSLTRARAERTFQFPLLVKWIDARERLSLQVHPPQGHARLPAGERGKTECWFVIHADAGAEIYLGLRRGIDRAALVRELARGTVDRCLNVFPARPGDFFFVTAGTPHAIGAGVLLAEIQHTGDTTFRLFDWNRVDPETGRARALHIESALDCIDFQSRPEPSSLATTLNADHVSLLSAEQSPTFEVAWFRVARSEQLVEPDRYTVLICVDGAGSISGGGQHIPLRRGDCVLLPASGRFACAPSPSIELLEAQIAVGAYAAR